MLNLDLLTYPYNHQFNFIHLIFLKNLPRLTLQYFSIRSSHCTHCTSWPKEMPCDWHKFVLVGAGQQKGIPSVLRTHCRHRLVTRWKGSCSFKQCVISCSVVHPAGLFRFTLMTWCACKVRRLLCHAVSCLMSIQRFENWNARDVNYMHLQIWATTTQLLQMNHLKLDLVALKIAMRVPASDSSNIWQTASVDISCISCIRWCRRWLCAASDLYTVRQLPRSDSPVDPTLNWNSWTKSHQYHDEIWIPNQIPGMPLNPTKIPLTSH